MESCCWTQKSNCS